MPREQYIPDKILVLEKYTAHPIAEHVAKRYPDAENIVVSGEEMNSLLGQRHDPAAEENMLFLGEAKKFISTLRGQADYYCRGPKNLSPITNGCYFSCEYCYMQANYRGRRRKIKFNLNSDDMLEELGNDIDEGNQLQIYNMGEEQDSLAFDYIYPLSRIVVPFFARKDARLLLLTKSDCVDNLMGLNHNSHTIVSWSINSDYVTRNIENGTAPLNRRVEAAKKVQDEGYPVRLRFDPLLLLSNDEWTSGEWKTRYNEMMDTVFSQLSPERITLGSLRFHPIIRQESGKRFGHTKLFDSEMVGSQCSDTRHRYRDEIREMLYSFIVAGIRERAGDIDIGLCKESEEMWAAAGLSLNKEKPACNCQL